MRYIQTTIRLVLCCFLAAEAALLHSQDEKQNNRPYELKWAGRTVEPHAPLCSFEEKTKWSIETSNAEATFARTDERQIWGQYTTRLTYRATRPQPQIRISPPKPLRIEKPFDAVTLWIYGNNWFGHTNWGRATPVPQVQVTACFSDSNGKPFTVSFMRVRWKSWFLCHERLSPELAKRVQNGGTFDSFLITNGTNAEPLTIYLDNLSVYKEAFAPLSFPRRRKPGVALFDGQTAGIHTGTGRLPFPTREETILPENLTTHFTTTTKQHDDAFVFTYKGDDGTLAYRLKPQTGTWSDISACWEKGRTIHPCREGGVYLEINGNARLPDQRKHITTEQKGNAVVSRWHVKSGTTKADVTYRYRLWNKSLVIDTIVHKGVVADVRYGYAEGLASPKLVTNPYYICNNKRPAVCVTHSGGTPLFLTGNTDWYRSNASTLFAENSIQKGKVYYNGGSRYTEKTDGKRNRCFERFFVTLSPRYEEMLPVIANPQSQWKQVTGTRIWRAHGAGDRQNDMKHWKRIHRYGMREIVVTDHETMWRDGGESFTFRTKAAPGKGGDKGAYDYARFMQDTLGFVYGPYNNFTDFAPVNEYWSTDMVNRLPDKSLQHAWTRCYAPKPTRAVEYCEKLAPQIEEKFRFSTAYCDVHTAVRPWNRVDYDARVPGAGTFLATFYAYGEIMLLQKKAWKGPVYSEGNNHFMYCGLTDGNYGQDQVYRIAENPWLVDFDLRRMHDLCCNFGMGNPGMFYTRSYKYGTTREEVIGEIDRFLAATVAFGHPGFLVTRGGMHNTLRSYYMLQQLQSRYTLSPVDTIRYAQADGSLLDTSRAVATGAYKRNQIVTRYRNGCITAVNGNQTEQMKVTAFGRSLTLPPNGYAGWTEDGVIDVLSTTARGGRFDYAATPEYIYIDGRGSFQRRKKAAGNGAAVCRKTGEETYEVILYQNARAGFAVNGGVHAEAFDEEGGKPETAEVRNARGLAWIMPVAGAFSYRLTTGERKATITLSCDRTLVLAGEKVSVRGAKVHSITIPKTAKAGERIWRKLENSWIDFTVTDLADAELSLDRTLLNVNLSSNLPSPERFTVKAAGQTKSATLKPETWTALTFDLGKPAQEGTEAIAVSIKAPPFSQAVKASITCRKQFVQPVPFPDAQQTGMAFRGKEETASFGASRGYVQKGTQTCGGSTKSAYRMHPPYTGGVGYVFLLTEPVAIPSGFPVMFRAAVGKGDGSDPGDGILYKVIVVDAQGKTVTLCETITTDHIWYSIECALAPWAGKTIQFKLVADVGKKDNSTGDWAAWADLRLESNKKLLTRTMKNTK